jgi:hypothetical protein
LLLQRKLRARIKLSGSEEAAYLAGLDGCMDHFRKVALSLASVARQFAAQHSEGKPPKMKEMFQLQGEYQGQLQQLMTLRGALADSFRAIPEVVDRVNKS